MVLKQVAYYKVSERLAVKIILAAKVYYNKNGKLPKGIKLIDLLNGKDGGEVLTTVNQDAWGEIFYVSLDNQVITLRCKGYDRILNTDDDLVVSRSLLDSVENISKRNFKELSILENLGAR